MQKLVRFVSVLGLICLLAILPEAQTQGRTAVGGDNALDPSESAFRFQKDDFAEFDSRIAITPSLAQVNAVAALGATAQWSAFGTPLSLVRQDNQPLAQGLTGAAATAVRGWLRSNRELFRLSDADVSALELVHDTQLVNSYRSLVVVPPNFWQPEAHRRRLNLGWLP